MKNNLSKKLLIAGCAFLIFSTRSSAQISVGPEAGFTASGLYDQDAETYAGVNIHVGATAHFQLNHFLAVRPSLLFKTGSMSLDGYGEKIKLNRISIPIPIMYSHVFDNGGTVFGGAGPNIMYHLSGKYEMDDMGSRDIEFGSGNSDMKRLDLGVHIKGGYQFGNGISLSTFANIGTTNLSNSSESKIRSLDAIGFSIGWMFGSNASE
ncbi:porin family protein [Flavihumibacter sp. CACIAM 22H1]|uniref:porin family protein n=1 Tax=Flavihumibacter sp. CACIAM 22H1 TaxID=1812911 RepID=UPI0007A8674B|nr:porin family protein [Flavihumibacter sp. CACIAM 22H1]KYP14204.1 MAG: hypothetical protein A1D16_01540 [Flavihumibacter sp. CACIAM 22H1]